MSQYRSLGRGKKAESGAYVPLLALAIVPLLVLCGLAIDFSRHYLMRHRLQRAVDAAAASAGQGLRLVPAFYTERSASDFTRFNLSMSGLGVPWPAPNNAALDLPGLTIQTSVTSGLGTTVGSRLEVAARLPVSFSLLRLIPGVAQSLSVSGRAVVGTPPVAVTLVLDVSGSMGSSAGAGGIKIDRLRDGAIQFLELLEDGDYLGVVLFGNGIPAQGTLPLQMISGAGGAAPNTRASIQAWLQQKLTASNLHGWTCIGCGILRARYADMLLAPEVQAMPRHMVIFTDGVPEYARSASGAYDALRRQPGVRPEYILGTPDDYATNCGWQATAAGAQGQAMEAIVESDLSRRAGITVHTIGVGWYPSGGADYCTATLRQGSVDQVVRNPWQSRVNHFLEVSLGTASVLIAGGTTVPPAIPVSAPDGVFPPVDDETALLNCTASASSLPARQVPGSTSTPAGVDDMGTLRPYILYRMANDVVNDIPYSLATQATTRAFPPMLYKRVNEAVSPFAPSMSITPKNWMPPTEAQLIACNDNPHDRAGWPCECVPFIGPARPRGITLVAQTGAEISARFTEALTFIKRPKLIS